VSAQSVFFGEKTARPPRRGHLVVPSRRAMWETIGRAGGRDAPWYLWPVMSSGRRCFVGGRRENNGPRWGGGGGSSRRRYSTDGLPISWPRCSSADPCCTGEVRGCARPTVRHDGIEGEGWDGQDAGCRPTFRVIFRCCVHLLLLQRDTPGLPERLCDAPPPVLVRLLWPRPPVVACASSGWNHVVGWHLNGFRFAGGRNNRGTPRGSRPFFFP